MYMGIEYVCNVAHMCVVCMGTGVLCCVCVWGLCGVCRYSMYLVYVLCMVI